MTTALHDPLGIVGTTVAEKYRILGVAGDGGFSIVYKAEHLIWQQNVAIKFFNVLEEAEDKMREKLLNDFIQEGKLMSELSSKSAAIVQARDIGKLARPDGGWIPYMVLEWLDGTPLDVVLAQELVQRLPPRSLQDTVIMLEAAAIALDVAHKAGVAHRDLKPANIMVMGDARADEVLVKMLDFGIAKVMAEHEELHQQLQMTGHHITAFTPNYGAPEQFSRNYGATGPWTDVYAMALIVLEILRGGERVLSGESFYELGLSSCDRNTRPTPVALGLDVPPTVDAVFAKALAVQVGDRYPTMGAFWADLHASLFPGSPTWRSTQLGRTSHDVTAGLQATPSSVTGSNAALATTATPPRSGGGGKLVIGLVGLVAVVGVAAVAYFKLAAAPEQPAETTSATATATAVQSAAPLLEWDGACPKGMKAVTGGTFDMGSDDDGFELWKPAHKVTLDTFCLDVNEVTLAKYKACVERDKCKPADTRPEFPKSKTASDEEHKQQLDAFAEFCNWDKTGRDDHPINCLDWHRADAYCKQLGIRLPTEAEWELAARGTDGRTFPWGNDTGDQTYMNAAGTEWRRWRASKELPEPGGLMYEADDSYVGTAPVGKFPRAQTQAGMMDMVGNVWEWTADWYALYKPEAQTNPKGPAAGDRKAIRGGGFNGEFSLWVNPAARFHQLATASVHAVGFRCAADVRSE